MTAPSFAIGDLVHVRGSTLCEPRTDRIARVQINDQGLTLYWLAGGGIFSGYEIDSVNPKKQA